MDEHKKRHISENKVQNLKLSTLMNRHSIHNVFTTLKNVADYFKDVKIEETFRSLDQKLVKASMWQFFSDKNHHSGIPLLQRSLEWNNNEHQHDLTSHTRSWTIKKLLQQKIASRLNTKKRHISENKVQNQKLSTLMNRHHIHNAFTTLKSVAVFFRDVITEETTSSQDQKLVETTNLWRQLFSDKNSPQCNFASAKIANSVDLMNGTTKNTARWLHSQHTVLQKWKKNCTTKKLHQGWTQKKDIFRKDNVKNQILVLSWKISIFSTPEQTKKASLCISKISKLKKHSVAKTRS